MRLHPTFKAFNAFMVFNCNWWGFYSHILPNLCFFSRKKGFLFATGGGSILALCQICVRSCQICVSFDKFVSDFAKFVFFLGKRGFNRCDCIPLLSPFAPLWYLIATGRYSIFSKTILPNKKAPGGDCPGCF